jgi:hypothetical protein
MAVRNVCKCSLASRRLSSAIYSPSAHIKVIRSPMTPSIAVVVNSAPHPVVRSHRHHDIGAAGPGSRRVCACSRQASRSRRMSSSSALNSDKRSSARANRLDRSRERIDTRHLGAVTVRTVLFLTAREEPTRDCASEYRPAVPCEPCCLPQ